MSFTAHYFVANRLWWPTWSNIRWYGKRSASATFQTEDKATTLAQIKTLVKKLYSKFDWTADSWTELWDSVCSPGYNYQRYRNGILKDDCDGFHALVYHCLQQSGITKCYLLSVIKGTGGHCVLIFKLGTAWYVNDYDTVYGSYASYSAAISAYKTIYINNYEGGSGKVSYNSLMRWDYSKKKWYGENTSCLKNK